jgi:hypothetical protein
MKCFDAAHLPVLTALAREFAVCDSWFCSLPGPTWPNRFFALGGSSADLDHSPTVAESLLWQTLDGFKFENGSILVQKVNWRIYAGSKVFALAHALKGIHIWDIRRYAKFASDVINPSYPAQFTWIVQTPAATRENEDFEESPSLPGFLYVAAKTDAEIAPVQTGLEAHANFVSRRIQAIRTRGQARDYFEEVRLKLLAAEPGT